jgi:hypothetical protein
VVAATAAVVAAALLAACAQPVDVTPGASESPSAEESASPSATPSPSVTESAEPTVTPEAQYSDPPEGEEHESEPSQPKPRKYAWAKTPGYPTYFPEVLPPTNDDGTVGSGCHPPDSDSLPDGVWRVFLVEKSYQEWPAWFEFDLLCSYSFEYPDAPENQYDNLYAERGWEYILTNDNPASRTLPIAEGAIGRGTTWDWAPVAWDQTWLGCGPCDTWIWVNDGEITELAAAYY